MPLPTTIWTQILQIHADPERTLDLLVRRYRQPILAYARSRRLQPADAEDVTQEVFLRVTRPDFLAKADRSKGRFRSLLLAVTNHVIASYRRHELAGKRDRRKEIPLGDFDLPAQTPDDPEFDRLWVKNLVDWALLKLDHDPQVRALRLSIEGRTYKQIAVELQRKEHDVTNWIHRAKPKVRAEIERLIEEYCTAEEVPAEVEALLKHI